MLKKITDWLDAKAVEDWRFIITGAWSYHLTGLAGVLLLASNYTPIFSYWVDQSVIDNVTMFLLVASLILRLIPQRKKTDGSEN